MLVHWFRTEHGVCDASEDTNDDDHADRVLEAQALEEFEKFVRLELATQVLEHCGTVEFTYIQAVLAGSPFVWHMFDILPTATSLPLDIILWYLVEYIGDVLLILPAAYGLICKAEFLAERATKGTKPCSISRCMCTFFWTVIVSDIVVAIVYLPSLMLNETYANKLPYVCFMTFVAILNLILYSKSWACMPQKIWQCIRGSNRDHGSVTTASGTSATD